MAVEFTLTGPVRVSAAKAQDLKDALDVSGFENADSLLGVLGITGAGSATIDIITGMQNENEDGWVTAVTFTAVTASNTWEQKRAGPLLKYIRFDVTALTMTDITFQINGILRET